MECSKCGAKWDVSKEMESKLVKCPFCGEGLKKAPAEKIIIKDVSSCVRYISNVYSADIFESKLKLISLVSDFLPSHDDDIRLLKTALDSGIVSRFKGLDESKIENERQNAILILTEKYFIGREHAERVTDWIISGFFSDYTTPKAEPESVSSASSTASAEPSVSQQGGAVTPTTVHISSTQKQLFPYFTDENGKVYYGVYEGDIVNGKRHGYGTQYTEGGIIDYQGEWKDDKRHGQGTMYYYDDITFYQGEWINNKYHGYGTRYWDDGKIWYQGEWQDGKYHGFGTKYDVFGKVEYRGQWVNGEKKK